ncbi:hypothetical protein E4T44_04432 [Aureobasidium sp. EXF-8845]|nr:hypothetical protein E4T44_04432 [Aureobasidium sp. EXF-8845]KAI4853256.1 hypothetical protein E4T45_04402 [Aureobasidium sp. EXF-8846]
MAISATKNMNRSRKTAWSGKVLIPMWTIQIAAILATIIGYILFLANYTRGGYVYRYDDINWKNPPRNTFVFISSIVFLILWSIALCMVIFQIVRFHKKNLPATTMLTMQIILGVFTTIAFLIELMGLLYIVSGGYKNLLDFFGTIIATAFIYGTLIYTGVIFHRRKLAKRHSANSYGMADYDEEADQGKNNYKIGGLN